MTLHTISLPHRTVLAVTGPDAKSYLQGLITTDLDDLQPGTALPGALLTPQGKILVDFLISPDGNGYRLDLPTDKAAEIAKRLMIYRLRAKVEISDLSQEAFVTALWGEGTPPATAIKDGRTVLAGWRDYGEKMTETATVQEYDLQRIQQGLVEGGSDYTFGDAFPHDAGLDAIGGLDYRKGCYIGQEVVSRMHHRGTARRRPVVVEGSAPLPPTGTPLTANGRDIGTLGTVSGAKALAIVRLDRAKAAIDQGIRIIAGDVSTSLTLPSNAVWSWPTDIAE